MTVNRAAFRLGLAPVLLLGCNMALHQPLPFLGPSLAVSFLAMSPERPKLKQLLGALILITALTWGFSRLFAVLSDSPAAVWVALLAVTIWAFARLAPRPGDLVATLTLISTSVVVVLGGFADGLGLAVPAVMAAAVLQAILATLLAHALLPSSPAERAGVTPPVGRPAEARQVVGRAVGLVVALGVASLLEDNSSILVALTTVTILGAAAESSARQQGHGLALANLAAAAAVLPLLAVAALRPDPLILMPLALAGGLWMAAGVGGGGWRSLVARAGMPVYVVLLGVLLPNASSTALSLLIDRLLTLLLVMAYGLAVLTMLRPDARDPGRLAARA